MPLELSGRDQVRKVSIKTGGLFLLQAVETKKGLEGPGPVGGIIPDSDWHPSHRIQVVRSASGRSARPGSESQHLAWSESLTVTARPAVPPAQCRSASGPGPARSRSR
jgi:hypothetical protein